MLYIGLERLSPTRKTAGAFARDAGTMKSVSLMRGPVFREGEIPGMVEIFKDDIKIGSFMTIEIARKMASFDKSA